MTQECRPGLTHYRTLPLALRRQQISRRETMSRVFKTRHFCRWMRKTELSDDALCKAVMEMEKGLIDANLGGHILKKRVALPGKGKRGSLRTLVATRKAETWFFLYGYEKNERANISDDELEALQEIAAQLVVRTPAQLDEAVRDGSLQEICHDRTP